MAECIRRFERAMEEAKRDRGWTPDMRSSVAPPKREMLMITAGVGVRFHMTPPRMEPSARLAARRTVAETYERIDDPNSVGGLAPLFARWLFAGVVASYTDTSDPPSVTPFYDEMRRFGLTVERLWGNRVVQKPWLVGALPRPTVPEEKIDE